MSKKNDWDRLRNAILERHAKKFNALLDDLEGEDFALQYLKVLEYCAPKLARTEIAHENTEDLHITVEHVIAENEIDLEDNS